jgi:phosphoenolpyruvate carboxylase
MQKSSHISLADNDLRLRDTTRLLGRLLGDIIRELHGEEMFDRTEHIRQLSVKFHSGTESGAALEAELQRLNLADMITFIRGFTFFSHLVNIAEDQHGRTVRSDQPLGHALEQLTDGPAQLRDYLKRALIMPVLTAHPTEVRRKSILDHEAAISAILDRVDTKNHENSLKREILLLWQTRLLRTVKPGVADEIENALSYFTNSFLPELPKFYADLAKAADMATEDVPNALRIGSWIGGDRDGNPFVTADTLRHAFLVQSRLVMRNLLEDINALGAELSIAQSRNGVSAALEKLADASGDTSEHRRDEPYRRVPRYVYARLAKSASMLTEQTELRSVQLDAPAYTAPDELGHDLAVVADSLRSHGAAILVPGRLEALQRCA